MVCLEASDRPPGSSRHGVGSEVRFDRLAPAPDHTGAVSPARPLHGEQAVGDSTEGRRSWPHH